MEDQVRVGGRTISFSAAIDAFPWLEKVPDARTSGSQIMLTIMDEKGWGVDPEQLESITDWRYLLFRAYLVHLGEFSLLGFLRNRVSGIGSSTTGASDSTRLSGLYRQFLRELDNVRRNTPEFEGAEEEEGGEEGAVEYASITLAEIAPLSVQLQAFLANAGRAKLYWSDVIKGMQVFEKLGYEEYAGLKGELFYSRASAYAQAEAPVRQLISLLKNVEGSPEKLNKETSARLEQQLNVTLETAMKLYAEVFVGLAELVAKCREWFEVEAYEKIERNFPNFHPELNDKLVAIQAPFTYVSMATGILAAKLAAGGVTLPLAVPPAIISMISGGIGAIIGTIPKKVVAYRDVKEDQAAVGRAHASQFTVPDAEADSVVGAAETVQGAADKAGYAVDDHVATLAAMEGLQRAADIGSKVAAAKPFVLGPIGAVSSTIINLWNAQAKSEEMRFATPEERAQFADAMEYMFQGLDPDRVDEIAKTIYVLDVDDQSYHLQLADGTAGRLDPQTGQFVPDDQSRTLEWAISKLPLEEGVLRLGTWDDYPYEKIRTAALVNFARAQIVENRRDGGRMVLDVIVPVEFRMASSVNANWWMSVDRICSLALPYTPPYDTIDENAVATAIGAGDLRIPFQAYRAYNLLSPEHILDEDHPYRDYVERLTESPWVRVNQDPEGENDFYTWLPLFKEQIGLRGEHEWDSGQL